MDNLWVVLLGGVIVAVLLVGGFVAFRDHQLVMRFSGKGLDSAMSNFFTSAKDLYEWHERMTELENLRTNTELKNLRSEEQKEQVHQQWSAHMGQHTPLRRQHLDAWKKAYERTIYREPQLRSLLVRVATPNNSKIAYYAMAIAHQWISDPQVIRRDVRTWESLLIESK